MSGNPSLKTSNSGDFLTKLGLEKLVEVRSTPKTVDPWTKTTKYSPNPEINFGLFLKFS